MITPCLHWNIIDESGDGQAFVSIGEQRVGRVSAFLGYVSIAASKTSSAQTDGLVCVKGRLTAGLGQAGFLLEVAEPSMDGELR